MAVAHQDGRITMGAAADTYVAKQFKLLGLNWDGGADGDQLVVQDQNNIKVYGWTLDAGNLSHSFVFPKPLPLTELTVSTLGGGAVTFYIDE